MPLYYLITLLLLFVVVLFTGVIKSVMPMINAVTTLNRSISEKTDGSAKSQQSHRDVDTTSSTLHKSDSGAHLPCDINTHTNSAGHNTSTSPIMDENNIEQSILKLTALIAPAANTAGGGSGHNSANTSPMNIHNSSHHHQQQQQSAGATPMTYRSGAMSGTSTGANSTGMNSPLHQASLLDNVTGKYFVFCLFCVLEFVFCLFPCLYVLSMFLLFVCICVRIWCVDKNMRTMPLAKLTRLSVFLFVLCNMTCVNKLCSVFFACFWSCMLISVPSTYCLTIFVSLLLPFP